MYIFKLRTCGPFCGFRIPGLRLPVLWLVILSSYFIIHAYTERIQVNILQEPKVITRHLSKDAEYGGDVSPGELLKPEQATQDADSFPEMPIQLVRPDPHHKRLVIIEENLRLLNMIPAPVATVAVVGKFHSGKSFLMNQLMGKSAGFGVGPSVRPQTMGIWMWGRPVQYDILSKDGLKSEKVNIIFLDTEGFAATNVSENYDAKIFAVATLLSSQLLYNSVKIIDQGDIDYLELLARRTQLFALKSQMSRARWTKDFNRDLLSFPPLIWVLQDFVQETELNESPTSWLRKLMATHTRETDSYDISLLDIFKSVDCHTMFLPATSRQLLRDLTLAHENDLTSEYRQERDQLIMKLKRQIVVKEKNQKPISGSELRMLLEVLVTAANEGSLSDVPSRWDAFLEKIKRSAVEDCINFYEAEMNVLLQEEMQGEAIKVSKLEDWHDQTVIRTKELIRHLLMGLDDALQQGIHLLSAEINARFERTRDLNDKKVRLKCNQIQHNLEISVEQNLQDLKLPLTTKEFTERVREVRDKFSSELTASLITLIERIAVDDFEISFARKLKLLFESVQQRNNDQISLFLSSHIEKAVNSFSTFVGSHLRKNEPLKPSILKQLIEESSIRSTEQYKKSCSMFEGETFYEPQLALLEKKITAHTQDIIAENERLASINIKRVAADLADQYAMSTDSKSIKLPMNDSDLDSRLKAEVEKTLSDYETHLSGFEVYQAFNEQLSILVGRMRQTNDERRKENVAAFQRIVQNAFERSKKIIFLSADKFSTVFSVKQFIRNVCSVNLDEGESRHWEPYLKVRVMENFIETDTEIIKLINSKDGFYSGIIGFIEWVLWLFGLYGV